MKLCNTDLHGNIEFRCGKSKAGYAFQDVLAILKQKKLKAELLFEEYEMDISLQYHGELYYCEIKLNETNAEQVAYVRVSEEQKEKWKESGRKCGILYYYIKTGRLDFYRMAGDLPEYVETLQ